MKSCNSCSCCCRLLLLCCGIAALAVGRYSLLSLADVWSSSVCSASASTALVAARRVRRPALGVRKFGPNPPGSSPPSHVSVRHVPFFVHLIRIIFLSFNAFISRCLLSFLFVPSLGLYLSVLPLLGLNLSLLPLLGLHLSPLLSSLSRAFTSLSLSRLLRSPLFFPRLLRSPLLFFFHLVLTFFHCLSHALLASFLNPAVSRPSSPLALPLSLSLSLASSFLSPSVSCSFSAFSSSSSVCPSQPLCPFLFLFCFFFFSLPDVAWRCEPPVPMLGAQPSRCVPLLPIPPFSPCFSSPPLPFPIPFPLISFA